MVSTLPASRGGGMSITVLMNWNQYILNYMYFFLLFLLFIFINIIEFHI